MSTSDAELHILTASEDLDDYDILAINTLSVAVPYRTTESFRKLIWAAMVTYMFALCYNCPLNPTQANKKKWKMDILTRVMMGSLDELNRASRGGLSFNAIHAHHFPFSNHLVVARIPRPDNCCDQLQRA